MSKSRFESPEFKREKAKWYRKLRKKGFVDIEHGLHQHSNDRTSTWYFQAQYSPEALAEHARYFQLAGQLLHDHAFVSPMDKTIWKMHATGATMREIMEALNLSSGMVTRTIARIAEHIK